MSIIFSLGEQAAAGSRATKPSRSAGGFYAPGTNGVAVFLIHGLTGTPNELKSLATFLNRKGYTVKCPRLCNHGEPLAALKRTTWRDFYGGLKEEFASKELAGFTGPVIVGGLSMGALLALLLADEFPERVAGAVCLAPTLFYDGWNTPGIKFLLPLASQTPLKHFFYFKEEPPYGIKNEVIRERIHRYYAAATLDDLDGVGQYGYPFFPVTLLCQLQRLVGHLTRRLPFITAPVQMIQAKDDDVASVRNSKFIYDRVGSTMKEMILLYDSYHVITADHERDLVAEKVEGFIARACAQIGIEPHARPETQPVSA